MLTPMVSVSAIGLVGALAALLLRRQPARSAFGRGLLGAWVGFLLGGVLGVVIYVVTLNGAFVVYLGHLGALLGTIWLLRSREPIRPMRRILPFGIRR